MLNQLCTINHNKNMSLLWKIYRIYMHVPVKYITFHFARKIAMQKGIDQKVVTKKYDASRYIWIVCWSYVHEVKIINFLSNSSSVAHFHILIRRGILELQQHHQIGQYRRCSRNKSSFGQPKQPQDGDSSGRGWGHGWTDALEGAEGAGAQAGIGAAGAAVGGVQSADIELFDSVVSHL